VNLLFAITNPSHSPVRPLIGPVGNPNQPLSIQIGCQAIAESHLNARYNLEWADLFTPVPYSSASRARAFLWLCYHYLESTSGNPYVDEFASTNPGLAPQLVPLTSEGMATENVDTSDELAWGVQMSEKRLEFLAKVKVEKEQEELEKARVKEQERERLAGGLTAGHPKSTARSTSLAHHLSGGSSRAKKEKRASKFRAGRDGRCPFLTSITKS